MQEVVALLAQSAPGPDERHQVLLLLDEFASLGRMDVLRDSLAFVAEYGVRVCTVIQGLGQLALYGRAGREAILQNSAIQVLFAANDETAARYVSDRLGTKTIRMVLRSFASGSGVAAKPYGSAAQALLLPEEGRQLGPEEALLFKEGVRPVRGGKIRYYRDPAFARRQGRPPADVPKLEPVSRSMPRFSEELADAAAGAGAELRPRRGLTRRAGEAGVGFGRSGSPAQPAHLPPASPRGFRVTAPLE